MRKKNRQLRAAILASQACSGRAVAKLDLKAADPEEVPS